jgi:integrase
MSLYKRGSVYWLNATIDGRRYQVSTDCTGKEAAEKWAAGWRVQRALSKVDLADRPKYTVGELLDQLKTRWQLDEKATKQNLSLLKKAKEDFGTKMADELTAKDLERYALRRKKQKYANATTNRIFQCIRRAFNLAGVTWPDFDLLDEKDNVREGVFKREEMQKVLNNLADDGLRDFVAFAYATGMRKGEASVLRWSFLQGDSIIVPAGVCKNRTPHRIPVAGPLVQILERRKTARCFESAGTTRLSEYIFHRGDGLPVGDFKKSWRTACTKAGCGNRIFHDLRRTACSDMIDAGVPQSTIMSISGHKTIEVFLRYALSNDESRADALEKTAKYRANG